MFIATVVVSALFALVLIASGVGKLRKDPRQLETMRNVHFPEDRLWLLAVAELAGAAGLLAGLYWWPLGVAAAAGTVLYFLGAVTAHLRAGDRNLAPAVVFLGVGVVAVTLRALTI